MKFSIIIPIYNSEKYINRLLDSIEKQTFKDYEIIVVNDGSTDNSLNILKEYQKKYLNIKIFDKKNEGPGIARRFGYEKANGDLIFFIDSDDYLYDETVLEDIYQIDKNTNFDVLFFDFISIRGEREEQRNLFVNEKFKVGIHDIKELDKTIVEGALWGKIMKRNYLKEEYFYNSNNFEDYYTTYKYLNKCNNFYYIDKIFYVADKNNSQSLTKTVTDKKIFDAIKIIKEIYSFSNLKKSVSLLALHYYIFGYRMLFNLKDGNKKELRQELESLYKIFPPKVYRDMKKSFNYKYFLYFLYIKIRKNFI